MEREMDMQVKRILRRSTMTVLFEGHPGSDLDEKIRRIFVKHGSRLRDAGTNLISGERDMRWSVRRDMTKIVREELKTLGVRSKTR